MDSSIGDSCIRKIHSANSDWIGFGNCRFWKLPANGRLPQKVVSIHKPREFCRLEKASSHGNFELSDGSFLQKQRIRIEELVNPPFS